MTSRFARAQTRLHRVCADRLSDAVGTFLSPGCTPITDLPLMVDRNLEYVGPDGSFMSDVVGITFNRADLASAERGDVFTIGCERFVVEKLISDDGHMITAATMVQT